MLFKAGQSNVTVHRQVVLCDTNQKSKMALN